MAEWEKRVVLSNFSSGESEDQKESPVVTTGEKGLGRAPSVGLAKTDRAHPSDQVRFNHDTAGGTYRCFLPDLTGFVLVCCVVSNRRRELIRSAQLRALQKGIQPR